MKYIWDTNTAIYYLQQVFPEKVEVFVDSLLEESPIAISAITEIELLCWRNAAPTDLKLIENFIEDCLLIELSKPVKLQTIEIRKLYKIKLPDAIIAASALVYDLTLLSRDLNFKQIENLKLINPWGD